MQVWDSISFKTFLECPRKYAWLMREKIRAKGQSIHLLWGIAYHSALEAFDKARGEGASHDEAVRLAVKEAISHRLPESQDNTKTPETLVRSVVWYCDEYRNDPFETASFGGKQAVELTFQFHISDEVIWAGHIDKVVRYNGRLYFIDRKTTKGQLNQKYFKKFELDAQMLGYTYASRVAFPEPFAGGIIDACQVGVNFTRFGRHVLNIEEHLLDEFEQTVLTFSQLAKQFEELDLWPMNPTACDKFMGCEYALLCKAKLADRKFFLNDYERFEWDPEAIR